MRLVFRLLVLMIAVAGVCFAEWGCRSPSEPASKPAIQERVTTRETPSTTQPASSGRSASGVVWKSVREHPGVGRLAIVLNPPGETRVISESRQGGISELEIDFPSPIKLVKPGAVRAESSSQSVTPSAVRLASPTKLLIQFAGLKEGCYHFDLSGAIDGIAGVAECKARVLEGDINSDGHISLTDMLYIKSKIGQPVLAENAALDIDVNGKIETADVQRAKAAIHKAIACD